MLQYFYQQSQQISSNASSQVKNVGKTENKTFQKLFASKHEMIQCYQNKEIRYCNIYHHYQNSFGPAFTPSVQQEYNPCFSTKLATHLDPTLNHTWKTDDAIKLTILAVIALCHATCQDKRKGTAKKSKEIVLNIFYVVVM